MATAHHTETIRAPIAAVYQQWLDLESFPGFAPMVRSVTVTAELYSRWTLSIGRLSREFTAEITEQLPEERVAWRSLAADALHTGIATFTAISDSTTRVGVSVEWTPSTRLEHVAVVVGADDRAVRSLLRGFARHAEQDTGPKGHSYITLKSVDADD